MTLKPFFFPEVPSSPAAPRDRSAAEGHDDLAWPIALLSSWIVGGFYIDGWAHGHLSQALETFFTPWHAVLYSGVAATGLYLFSIFLQGRAAGRSLRDAIPPPYGLTMVGFVLFGIGGALDLSWHTLFGIERGYEAILSPTHLLLFVSVTLIVTGPLRAAWRSGSTLSMPAVLSATLLLSMLTFVTHDTHPFTSQWAAQPGSAFTQVEPQLAQELGVLEVMLQAALLMGVALILVSRSRLRPGSLTFIFTINATLVTLLNQPDPVILVGLIGGVVADVLLIVLRPSALRPAALRVFAFSVPATVYLTYFLAVLAADGIWWRIHVWIGSIVMAGLIGLLVSYLVLPAAGGKQCQ
jgi:hypothetical protein